MLTDAEIMSQVLTAFQGEQAEHRQAIGEILLELEREPNHPQRRSLLDQLFREAHSLKGGSRAAGLVEIEQMAHQMEDLFSLVRQGTCELTPVVCDPVYAALDAIGTMMAQVNAGQAISLDPYKSLMELLAQVAKPVSQTASAEENTDPDPVVEPELEPVVEVAPTRLSELIPTPAPATELVPMQSTSLDVPEQNNAITEVPWESGSSTVRLATTTLDNLLNETGELITSAVRARQRAHDARALADITSRWRRIWRQVGPALARMRSNGGGIKPTVHYLDGRDTNDSHISAHATGMRVMGYDADVAALLDVLGQANGLINELERGLSSHVRLMTEDQTRLATVTDRLHDQVRRTRMLPVATLFGPLRLQIREMARAAGKQVALHLDDGGAEADRQVLDQLREVLIHLLRNAIDHGIEHPDGRARAGKPAIGRITLTAFVSGDRLNLLVEDDGNGLDLDAIRQRALVSGLVSETDLSRMSESDLTDLIFLPGFSTRYTVSALSGRGVGLDIVHSRVERMHGRVSVRSAYGAGSSFTVSVPLSLTSSHGLLLRIGQYSYVVPLESVQRILPVSQRSIQSLEGRSAIMLDTRPIALVQLADLLGIDDRERTQGAQQMALLLGSGDRTIACLVDVVLGEQELVVHRLPAPLQRVRYIAGATILADGSVVPMLDVVDLLRASIRERRAPTPVAEPEGPKRTPVVLVADDSITTRTLEKNILESAGYEVRLATDGAEALSMLRVLADDGGCDLLLSDVDMPRLNGFDLTAQLRAESRFQHLPVVLVTSLDTPADRERGIAAGADAYIVKRSFDQQVLLDTIARLI